MKLKVEYASDVHGNLVPPNEAKKGEDYYCPACREKLIFRSGKVKVTHFAHGVSKLCNQETIIHKTAKLLIQKAIIDWKAGVKDSPTLLRNCYICREEVEQYLPDKVGHADLEVRLLDGHIVDIALVGDGKPMAAIEIRVTHKVEDEKAASLTIPFIELDGFAILDNLLVWKPLIDKFKRLICKKCLSKYNIFRKKIREISLKTNVEIPSAVDYLFSFTDCYKCGKEILVFSWSGDKPTKKPIPRTIEFRYSHTAETKYWANTCPYCKALQGDWFLYNEPDGPFFALGYDCEDDKDVDETTILMRIASNTVYDSSHES